MMDKYQILNLQSTRQYIVDRFYDSLEDEFDNGLLCIDFDTIHFIEDTNVVHFEYTSSDYAWFSGGGGSDLTDYLRDMKLSSLLDMTRPLPLI